MAIVEGTESTLWVFVALVVLIAFVGGVIAGAVTRDIRHYRRRLREVRGQEPTIAQRLEKANAAVVAPDYGRAAAVDAEPPIRTARSMSEDYIPMAGIVLPDMVVAREPQRPAVPPRPETLAELAASEQMDPAALRAATDAMETAVGFVEAALAEVWREPPALVTDPETLAATDYDRSVDDDPDNPWRNVETTERRDRDDDPPAGGAVAATSVMPRYQPGTPVEPWSPTRWVPPPGPLTSAARRTVAYLQAPIRVFRASAAAGLLVVLRAELDQAAADTAQAWGRPRGARMSTTTGRHRRVA